MKKITWYLKTLISELIKDNAMTLAAAQAYYFLLSLAPLLILILSILPYLSINPELVVDMLKTIIPQSTTSFFEEQITTALTTQNGGLLTFGVLGTIWSASNAINSFIQSTNAAYNVIETRSFIKSRVLSIFLTLGAVVAVIISLLLPGFGKIIIDFLGGYFNLTSQTEFILLTLRWFISISVISLILTNLYYFAPNIKIPFKEVIPGAIIAMILWQVISVGFSFYVSNFGNFSATYGSIGGVIILMLWFFLTGFTLIIGAEINAINHRKRTNE